jgi:hypothetical protein
MTKRKINQAKQRNQASGCGCLIILVLAGLVYMLVRVPIPRAQQVADTPTRALSSTATITMTTIPVQGTPRPLEMSESATNPPQLIRQILPITVYAQGQVNVRSCASRECDILWTLEDGSSVLVDAEVNGEIIRNDNARWYRVADMGGAYVYTELVRTPAPAAAPQPTLMNIPVQSTVTCNRMDDLNCRDFAQAGDAQNHLLTCGDEDRLDADGDGRACEY